MLYDIPCPDCGGDKEVCVRHPMWGSPFCPEAYTNVECPTCEGDGVVEFEVEPDDLSETNAEWQEAHA